MNKEFVNETSSHSADHLAKIAFAGLIATGAILGVRGIWHLTEDKDVERAPQVADVEVGSTFAGITSEVCGGPDKVNVDETMEESSIKNTSHIIAGIPLYVVCK